ncbi:hypothetical protein SAY86_019164 [Trapa natans]|uniref:Uncharacterized protein n=1 Tax=Trapa natans TaxID=22666 RepID=A0AAN7LEF5_TRANT|nr:hypothetical protein SAY86_019164 [Trapa natans]
MGSMVVDMVKVISEQGDRGSLFTNPAIVGPRISFSFDLIAGTTIHPDIRSYKEAPVSSDFKFSVENYKMIPAEEIFLDGTMVPWMSQSRKTTTLKDELLVDNDEDGIEIKRGSGGRWMERWGLKKSSRHQHGHKKSAKRGGCGGGGGGSAHGMMLETVAEEKTR